ncbi:MAG TPA: X2-like carbohydrate binding domain-containing protein [Kribbella sp.]|uniref:X2-like carbohydrate binding domain-containing protein n=1 Tax=Kribbella sp. TaxID=1871183 RepID=UPI002D77F36D|nr:X2-like carbohydrate binding domain-containing protein [Kribbella sp.]HET6294770.1 X2-like carbohydrate binding domain-containing protein [Kribbella sp.]
MTRFLRNKATRGILAGVVAAVVLPVGLSASAARDPRGAPTPPSAANSAKGATTSASDSAASISTPANVSTEASPSLGPAGAAANKPYMGWSSYSMQVYSNDGGNWINAAQIIAQSDAMKKKLQPYGYKYINIDAAWNGGVDGYGRPVPSTKLYPNGFQAVIDHIHANGQKVGIYSIPGISKALLDANLPVYGAPGCTTGNLAKQPLQQGDYWGFGYRVDMTNPCAQKYIDSIADLFASWGIDFLKFDSVTPGSGKNDLSLDARDEVKGWSQALARHKIWLELSWALDINYADYWKQWANGWRLNWDVECYCPGEALTAWANISRLFPNVADWWRHGGPGGWNDLDSLNVGNGTMDGLTKDERRTAATLWAVSAAPFYIGNDMTKLDSYGLELLTNPEVIAVNQAGRPAQPVSTKSNKQVWYSLNADSSYNVAIYNLGTTEANITANFADLGLDGSATVRDLWARKDLGQFSSSYTAALVPPHGVRLLKVTPQKKAAIRVNDDDLRVSYDGAWQRNGNNEVPAVSEPLTVAVTDSGTPPAAPQAATSGIRTVDLNDNDPGIVYTGSWSTSTGRGFGDYQDDVHWTETQGDAFSYSFVGNGVDFVTEKDPSQGEVEIYVDGALKATVDTHADTRSAQQVVYSISDLPNGTHTIRGVKKSGQFMLVDKLVIRQESLLNPGTAAFDKAAQADVSTEIARDPGELLSIANAGKALVKGTDYTVAGKVVTIKKAYLATQPVGSTKLDFSFRGDYRDDVHATTANGAAVNFTFKGTGVDWTTALAPDQGEADVYLDGKLVTRVNLHGDARVTQRQVFTKTGLKDAQHTLRIVKVSGDVLRNDLIRYTLAK